MKITPPASATLFFCSGCSAMQVVHFMPTISTKIEIVHRKMDANISPRVPCTIAGDKNTAQGHVIEQVSVKFMTFSCKVPIEACFFVIKHRASRSTLVALLLHCQIKVKNRNNILKASSKQSLVVCIVN